MVMGFKIHYNNLHKSIIYIYSKGNVYCKHCATFFLLFCIHAKGFLVGSHHINFDLIWIDGCFWFKNIIGAYEQKINSKQTIFYAYTLNYQ